MRQDVWIWLEQSILYNMILLLCKVRKAFFLEIFPLVEVDSNHDLKSKVNIYNSYPNLKIEIQT